MVLFRGIVKGAFTGFGGGSAELVSRIVCNLRSSRLPPRTTNSPGHDGKIPSLRTAVRLRYDRDGTERLLGPRPNRRVALGRNHVPNRRDGFLGGGTKVAQNDGSVLA